MEKAKVLMLASVASMIDQFNMPNIRLMQEMGYEVHVMCNFKKGNTCDRQQIHRLLKILRAKHIICHQWDCPRNMIFAGRCLKAYQQLVRLMHRQDFAWMHCQSPIGGALARLAAHRQEVRVVYTAHGFHFYHGAPLKNWLLYYPVEKLLAHWTDVLITINREDYMFAKARLKTRKICYIPGVGIDSSRFGDCGQPPEGRTEGTKLTLKKYRLPENAVLLLSVGELSRRKNHLAVIQALAKMERTDVCYLICGQGAMQRKLAWQAQRLGVASRVRMPGFEKNVAQLYQDADIFVFPSLQEGMPAALMEAMAAGLPCIVSDIRGSRELITEQGGSRFRLYPGWAGFVHTQLREQMVRLLERPQLWERYGCYNREKMKSYDISVVNRKMKNIYEEFAEGNL